MASIDVLAVVSEIFPLIKTGGLADVTGALPGALGGGPLHWWVLTCRARPAKTSAPRYLRTAKTLVSTESSPRNTITL